jgi:mannose-6-phosphate isomerase-like protein (cupin superfamily)
MNTHEGSFKVVRNSEGRQFTVMGAKTMYKATAEDTRGAYSLAIETTLPHSGLPLHVHHREDEAMYILEGEYEIQCGDRTIRATKGTFVFLPRDVPNRFENVTDAPGSYIYITSPGGFETFMEQMSKAAASDPVDMGKVSQAMRKNGIEWRNNRD